MLYLILKVLDIHDPQVSGIPKSKSDQLNTQRSHLDHKLNFQSIMTENLTVNL